MLFRSIISKQHTWSRVVPDVMKRIVRNVLLVTIVKINLDGVVIAGSQGRR